MDNGYPMVYSLVYLMMLKTQRACLEHIDRELRLALGSSCVCVRVCVFVCVCMCMCVYMCVCMFVFSLSLSLSLSSLHCPHHPLPSLNWGPLATAPRFALRRSCSGVPGQQTHQSGATTTAAAVQQRVD